MLDFVAFDFETATTALPWAACSVGLVDVRCGRVADEYYTLINPGCAFDYRCSRIHGIEEQDVLAAPDLFSVMEELRRRMDGRVIVAHNAAFDSGVMKSAMEREGIEPPDVEIVCTVTASRRAFEGRQSYSLPRMTDLLGEFIAHNALDDARACARLFFLCAQRVGADSVEGLAKRLGIQPGRLSAREYYHCRVKGKRSGGNHGTPAGRLPAAVDKNTPLV